MCMYAVCVCMICVKVRTACELVLQYTQELLQGSASTAHLAKLLKSYRGMCKVCV